MTFKYTYVRWFDPICNYEIPEEVKLKIIKDEAARDLANKLMKDAVVEISPDGCARVIIEV